MESSDFSKLEKVVEKLLSKLGSANLDNASYIMQIEGKDKKIAELEQKIEALNSEQNDISGRVSSLINSIEDWEKSAESSPAPEVQKSEDEQAESVDDSDVQNNEGPLFSIGD
jgi:chromosome segregation ATPase